MSAPTSHRNECPTGTEPKIYGERLSPIKNPRANARPGEWRFLEVTFQTVASAEIASATSAQRTRV